MINFFKKLFEKNRKIENTELPSQGLFYKKDFLLFVKKASNDEIKNYEDSYKPDDISIVIGLIKDVVENNIIIKNGYIFSDIKSIDIVYLFFEIVKLTKGKKINLAYFDKSTEKNEKIEFSSEYFNYFIIGDLWDNYDDVDRCFLIEGYRYTLPSIGVENSLTMFLIDKSNKNDIGIYTDYLYDFTYFLSDKNIISFEEIDNLIQIFNFDMDKSEVIKIRNIVETFSPLQKYSLKKGDKVVEMNTKINLKKIWK